MSRELPAYVCHKRVRAARIKEIIDTSSDGSARIIPVELDVVSFRTGPGWLGRVRATHDDLGVYVVYEDGYESWSPTKVFTAGYEPEGVVISTNPNVEEVLRLLERPFA